MRGVTRPGDGGSRAAEQDPARWAELAASPASGARALWRIALFRRQPSVHRALAASPAASQSLLWCLGHFGRWDVKAAAALNPRCGRRVLKSLSFAGDWAVRAAAASNPVTHPKVLRDLVERIDSRVSLAAATNPGLPANLVDILVKDRNVFVRGAAASNPNAREDSLRQLARGMTEPAWVLHAVATNPSCPPELSDQLLTWIALGGTGHADPMFDPVACTGHPGDTRVAVFAWYTTQAREQGAERHPLWRVRSAVAPARRTLQQPIIAQLRRDPRPEVRRSVASFSPVPPRAIRELMGDTDPSVVRIAAQVREQNRKRYRVHRARRALRMAPRFVPLALLASGMLYSSLNSATSHVPEPGRSNGSSIAFGPEARLGHCDSPITPPQAGEGAVLPRISSGTVDRLPGGGWLACGPISAAGGSPVEALVLAAGTTGLRFLMPTTVVVLPDGRRYQNVTLHELPGHSVLMRLPGDPRTVLIMIYPDNMATKVITMHLRFGSAS